jgi:predicted flavoprotein YhiN
MRDRRCHSASLLLAKFGKDASIMAILSKFSNEQACEMAASLMLLPVVSGGEQKVHLRQCRGKAKVENRLRGALLYCGGKRMCV